MTFLEELTKICKKKKADPFETICACVCYPWALKIFRHNGMPSDKTVGKIETYLGLEPNTFKYKHPPRAKIVHKNYIKDEKKEKKPIPVYVDLAKNCVGCTYLSGANLQTKHCEAYVKTHGKIRPDFVDGKCKNHTAFSENKSKQLGATLQDLY